MRRGLIVLMVLAAFGCATVHSGHPVSVDPSLLVSATVRPELSTPYFSLVEFTFENTGPNWVRLIRPTVDLGDPQLNDSVIVTAGDDLRSWGEAMQARKNIKDANLKEFLGSVSLLGIIGAVVAPNNLAKNVGTGIAAGGLAALSVNGLKSSIERARDVKVFPDSHLYAGDLNVPPGLFLKRWVVFYSPNANNIDFLPTLSVRYSDLQKQAHLISLPIKSGS